MSQFKDCLPGICIPTIFALWWKVITSFSFNSVQGYLGILAAADTGTVFQILQAINCKVQLPQSRNWADRNIYKNRKSLWGGKKPAIWSLQLFCLQNCHVWQKWWSKLQIFFGSVLKKFTNLSFKHFCVTCMPPLYLHVSSSHSAHTCNAHLPWKNNSQFPFLIPDLW